MMSKDTFIRARTTSALKNQAESIFATLGLNTTEAINLFLVQVTMVKGLPFQVKIPNAETLQAIEDMHADRDVITTSLEEFKASLGY